MAEIKIEDEKLNSLLEPLIKKAKNLQDQLSTDRKDYYERYRCEPYGNERKGWAQSIAPVIYDTLQQTLPSLMELFVEDSFLLTSDDEQRAENFKKLIMAQLFRLQNGEKKFYDFFYNADLYHYAVFKIYKKDDYELVSEEYPRVSEQEMAGLSQDQGRQVTKYTENTLPAEYDQNGVETVPKSTFFTNVKAVRKELKYSGPFLEVVPPWEFYYSPDCKIEDWGEISGRLVYHEVKRNLNYIRKKEKSGLFRPGTYDKIKEKSVPTSTQFASQGKADEQAIKFEVDGITDEGVVNDPDNELLSEVTIKECYYQYDIDNDGLLEPVIVWKCDDVICAIIENEYGKPTFRLGSLSPEPHKVLGIPMPAVLDNDQRIHTNLLRLIQDGAAMSVYRNVVTPDVRMYNQLQNRSPFSVIQGDPTKIGEVNVSDPSQYILKAYELMKANVEEKTGQTRYNQGLDADSLNKTATGISLISQASSKRMRLVARLLAQGVVTGVIRDFIFINQKWPPTMDLKRMGINISTDKEDLGGYYTIDIDVGVGPAEKQQMANQLDLFIQFATAAGLQMGIMQPVHIIRAQKKKFKLLGIKIDDLMMDEQEFMQQQMMMQQQQQAMMQQQQMQGGGNGGAGIPGAGMGAGVQGGPGGGGVPPGNQG